MNKVIDAPQGEKITMDGNNLNVPNKPIIPFILLRDLVSIQALLSILQKNGYPVVVS